MGIADREPIGRPKETDLRASKRLMIALSRQVKRARRGLVEVQSILDSSPNGAQGCVDALSADDYAEVATMIQTLQDFHNTHRSTGRGGVTVTLPSQIP